MNQIFLQGTIKKGYQDSVSKMYSENQMTCQGQDGQILDRNLASKWGQGRKN